MKSPKPRNKAQRKVDYKNYDAITMRRNYETKLSGEIMTRNYQLVYYEGIRGILASKEILIFIKSLSINDHIGICRDC